MNTNPISGAGGESPDVLPKPPHEEGERWTELRSVRIADQHRKSAVGAGYEPPQESNFPLFDQRAEEPSANVDAQGRQAMVAHKVLTHRALAGKTTLEKAPWSELAKIDLDPSAFEEVVSRAIDGEVDLTTQMEAQRVLGAYYARHNLPYHAQLVWRPLLKTFRSIDPSMLLSRRNLARLDSGQAERFISDDGDRYLVMRARKYNDDLGSKQFKNDERKLLDNIASGTRLGWFSERREANLPLVAEFYESEGDYRRAGIEYDRANDVLEARRMYIRDLVQILQRIDPEVAPNQSVPQESSLSSSVAQPFDREAQRLATSLDCLAFGSAEIDRWRNQASSWEELPNNELNLIHEVAIRRSAGALLAGLSQVYKGNLDASFRAKVLREMCQIIADASKSMDGVPFFNNVMPGHDAKYRLRTYVVRILRELSLVFDQGPLIERAGLLRMMFDIEIDCDEYHQMSQYTRGSTNERLHTEIYLVIKEQLAGLKKEGISAGERQAAGGINARYKFIFPYSSDFWKAWLLKFKEASDTAGIMSILSLPIAVGLVESVCCAGRYSENSGSDADLKRVERVEKLIERDVIVGGDSISEREELLVKRCLRWIKPYCDDSQFAKTMKIVLLDPLMRLEREKDNFNRKLIKETIREITAD